jgi:hypothetical protein
MGFSSKAQNQLRWGYWMNRLEDRYPGLTCVKSGLLKEIPFLPGRYFKER